MDNAALYRRIDDLEEALRAYVERYGILENARRVLFSAPIRETMVCVGSNNSALDDVRPTLSTNPLAMMVAS